MMKPADNLTRVASVERFCNRSRPSLPAASVLPRVIRRRRRVETTGSVLKYTRRSCARVYARAEIVFRPGQADLFYKADMFNHSVGGMYFETARPLAPKTPVRIKIREKLYASLYSGGDIFEAEVVWCLDLSDDSGRRFGVGVAFRDIRGY